MSLPKEPRQLMINLMYLVLTALLAMNVSSEILNAFKIVDTSINSSSKNIAGRSANTIENFKITLDDKKVQADERKHNKVKVCMGYAQQAIKMREDLEKEILVYKDMIIQRAGGIDPLTNDVLRRDDLDASTYVMIEHDKKGPEMLDKLKKFKKAIAALVPLGKPGPDDPGGEFDLTLPASNDSLEAKLPLNFDVLPSEHNVNNDWSFGNFNMVPAVGAITIIDKYINDIRNSESIVVDELWVKAVGQKNTKEPVFTQYDVLVSPSSSYLLPCEKYTATLMLGAYNDKVKNINIMVNGRSLPVENGVATYTATADKEGEQKFNVSASYQDPNDNKLKDVKAKPFSYYVGQPQASISLDKMNVFYIGVDNPITFAASGVPASSLSFTTENCTLTKAEGVNKYMVRVTEAGKKANIALSGKLSDGTTRNFGTFEYRIKRIPDPYPVVANKRGGVAGVNEMKAQQAMFAKLDNFDFDAKFNIISFDVTRQARRSAELDIASSKSEYLTGEKADKEVAALMSRLKLGDKLYFENIKARGPDGQARPIGSLIFTLAN